MSNLNRILNNTMLAFLGGNGIFDELNFSKNIENRFADVNYPPCNIKKIEYDNDICGYIIELALAGFKKDDINVKEFEERGMRYLHIDNIIEKDNKKELESDYKISYIKRSISKKDFSLDFQISNELEIVDAKMEDGLLSITLNVMNMKEASVKRIEIK